MEPAHIGRYEIHSPLGRGGMGTVYRAHDPSMERWVAIKAITVQDAYQRARFQREVRAAGSLNHPHITTIYDVGEEGNLAYIVMELVEGETLANRLSGPMSWPQAVELLLPICQALAYAHSRGVIHRDVKPANVLISTEGVVKLTDFGVARLEAALRRITESGSTVGTPLYTAPEQIRNEVVDGRADLFSVGIVLFELITGRHPFTAREQTLAQVVYRITQPEPANLAPLAVLTPPALVEVVGRALNKEVTARFATADEMALALTACLEQSGAVSQPSLPPASVQAASSPTSPRLIEVVPSDLSLSPAEEALLLTAFAGHDRLYIEHEFSSGYSGARVLLATPVRSGRRLAQIVLKLDTPAAIDHEWQAYQEYVKDTLPPVTARILESPLYAADGQLALLHYNFAGGLGNTPPESLRTYYAQRNGQQVAALLERGIFQTFGPKWWLQRQATDLILRREYDRLLPVHLVVELRDLSQATMTPRILVARKTNAHACRQLGTGQLVQIQGFILTEIRTDQAEVTLEALPPSGSRTNPIRVRVTGLSPGQMKYELGQVVPTLIGVVRATRHELLRQLAEPVLFDQALDQKQITIGSQLYPNPLYDYESLLDQHISVMKSIIHGDLNLENILVTPASGLAWLIDFATTREGHNLYDFIRLEAQVITKLLPQAGVGPEAVVRMMYVLHEPEPSAQQLPVELQKPLAVLAAIRRMVKVCLYSRESWDEYYLGLVITLLGALKFKELDNSARELALAAAATVRGLISIPSLQLTPPPVPAPSPTPSSSRRKIVAGAVVLAVLAVLVGLGFWFWEPPLSSPNTPTSLPPAEPLVDAATQPTPTYTLTATPTLTPLPSPSPTPTLCVAEGIAVAPLDVRSGPGVDYPAFGSVSANTSIRVTGRNANSQWWQIAHPGGPGGYGWIEAQSVELSGTCMPPLVPVPPLTITSTPTTVAILAPPACPTPTFYRSWPDNYPSLGCPVEGWQSDFTFQWFDQGLMIWRKNPSPAQIYVLYEEGNWRGQVDPEGPRWPSCPEAGQTGELGPIFSFGLIWCEAEMDRLGLPVTEEMASENSPVEEFEHGLAFKLGQADYVLFENNTWVSSTPGPTKVTPTPLTTPDLSLMLEDFEAYNTAALRQTYSLNDAWGKNELVIDVTRLTDIPEQGQVLVLSYDIKATSPDHYVGIERNLPTTQDWSNFKAVQFWVRNGGTTVDLIFQWGEVQSQGDEVWRVRLPLQLGETRSVEIPLTGQFFSRADWSPVGNTQMDLDQVRYYAFFVERTQAGSGTIYLDSVKLLSKTIPSPAPSPTPTPTGYVDTGFRPTAVFEQPWNNLDQGNGSLGYPTGPAITDRNYARQFFERGFMFWWESLQDPQPIWVIYTPDPLATQGDTWIKYEDRWQAGQPEYPPECPEAGPPLGPKSGFGLIWCHQAGVKDQLGRPLDTEFGSGNVFPKGAVQFFQGGVMLENPAEQQVWVLVDGNGWYRFGY